MLCYIIHFTFICYCIYQLASHHVFRSKKKLKYGDILLFDDIRSSVGITDTTNLTTSGKFIVKIEGLYLITAQIMSVTQNSKIGFYVNGERVAKTYIGYDSSYELNRER